MMSILSEETGAVKQYTKPSKLYFFVSQPKWFTFEGDLTDDKDLDKYVGELAQMLLGAKKFIHGVAGEFCSRVWNHDRIINALQTLKAEDISFICGPKLDIKNLEFIKLVKNKKIRLLLTTERQEEHFRVTDKGVIIEGHHGEFQPERRAIICKDSAITNDVYDNKFKFLGEKLKAEGKLEPVEANEILTKFKPCVYDKDENKNYRKPKKEEIEPVFKIVNGRKPTEEEIEEILKNSNYN